MSELFGDGLLRHRARRVEAAITASPREEWDTELLRRRESVARWRGLRGGASAEGLRAPALHGDHELCLRR
jgi:hypothetical protein